MKPTDRDLSLKILTKMLFEQLGYVSEIGIEIASKSYRGQFAREQFSDFDVLGVRFEVDLHQQRIAAECKSGESKALEELLKLKGILTTFGIARGYFIKSRISQNARELAATIDVSTMDEDELRSLLAQSYGVDIEQESRAEGRRLDEIWKLEASVQERYPRVHKYLRFEFWNLPAYRNMHNLMKLATALREPGTPEDPTGRYLFHRLLQYVTITVLQLAARVLSTSLRDPVRGVAVNLFGGPRERREREILFDNVSRLLPKESRGVSFEPDFLPALNEAVTRLVRSAPAAARIPHFISAVTEERILHIGRRKPEVYDTVTRKLGQDLCLFLIKEAGLGKTLGAEILAY